MLVNKSVRMSTSLEICMTTTYLNVLEQRKGVDLIKIHANQPDEYVLALCDAVFEDSELAELEHQEK